MVAVRDQAMIGDGAAGPESASPVELPDVAVLPTEAAEGSAHPRVGLYLRALGLPAGRNHAAHCHRFLGEARLVCADAASPAEVDRQAVRLAQRSYENWMERLTAGMPGSGGSPAPSLKPLVALRLQNFLREHPEAFLKAHTDDDALRLMLLGTARPWGAPASRRHMPHQPLGKLPSVLRHGFWVRLFRQIRARCRTLARTMRRRRAAEAAPTSTGPNND